MSRIWEVVFCNDQWVASRWVGESPESKVFDNRIEAIEWCTT